MTPPPAIKIEGHHVGAGERPFVIAEVSGNHNGSLERALEIIDAVADSGAQAVKFQTYTADTLTIDVDAPAFRVTEGHELWGGRNLYQLYQEAHTPWEWHPALFQRAREHGLVPFSSPFDPTAVDFLVAMDVPAFKVASFELVDLPLIRRMAATGRPLIISTGMAEAAEIDEAVVAARGAGATEIALLKASSAYPSPPEAMQLGAIRTMRERWDVPVGLSDHTLGDTAAIAAVALGACIVEKHFKAAGDDASPDAAFSLDPAGFRRMVDAIRFTESAVAGTTIGPAPAELESRRFRRSLFVVEDVEAGEAFTDRNVRSIRPADGLHTRHLETVLGRHAASTIPRGTPLAWDLVEGGEPRAQVRPGQSAR